MNKFFVFTRTLCLLVMLAPSRSDAAKQTQAGPPHTSAPAPLRLAFAASIFKNLNANDMLAAMSVWAQTISESEGISVHPNMMIYSSPAEIQAALQSGAVDAITLNLSEFIAIPDTQLTGPFLRNEKSASLEVKFVLLAPRDGKVSSVAQLADATLSIDANSDAFLAEEWLNAQCVQAELGPLPSLVRDVTYHPKLSTAILSVFFGKSDACLVSRSGFESMAELNPQVGKKLAVIMESPPVIPSFFAFRATLPQDLKNQLTSKITDLHTSIQGEQVLNVFKSSRMVEVPPAEMQSSIRLLSEWRKAGPHQTISRLKDQNE